MDIRLKLIDRKKVAKAKSRKNRVLCSEKIMETPKVIWDYSFLVVGR